VTNLSTPVKEFICHMAMHGWVELPGVGFIVTANGVRLESAFEIFGADAAISGSDLIVQGESARNFMVLYRRAAESSP